MICEICKREFKNYLSLGSHLGRKENSSTHLSKEEYYNKFLGDINYCYCGKKTKFLTLHTGYSKHCSCKCSANNKITRNKCKKTIKKKYGVEHVSQSDKFKEKYKKTCLEKYGVESVFQVKEFKEKIKKTNLNRYGVENVFQLDEIKEKSKKTLLENYGVDNVSYSNEIKEKKINTCIRNHGVSSYFKTKEFKEKSKKTLLENYGVNHYTKTNKYKEDLNKKFFNRLLNSSRLKDLVTPLFKLEDYKGIKYEYPWKCTKCETEFEDNLDNGKVPRCPTCYPKLNGTSIGEQEVLEFVKQYYPNAKQDRSSLDGKEIDVYILELKLGIEYNGLYWHSEIGNNTEPKYHQDKHLLAKEKGIHLIQIFEDEWLNKQDIVKSILLNKMGKSFNKIFARKCKIKSVSNKESKQFLFDNHLQGEINGIHIGLYHQDQLVSLITMGKSRFNKSFDYEILRFCNKKNTSVIGGLSKLLSYFKKEYNPESIITYADARYGEGTGYLNSDFVYKELTSPNYYYIKNQGRESRIKYQKHKLKDLLESFDSNLTEWQNMQLNGFDRIWDCGNYVYNLKF